MVSELKPCPFCPDGGRLEQRTYEATWVPIAYKGSKYASAVNCYGCGIFIHGYGKSQEEAEIDAQNNWNTRYQPTCHMIGYDGVPACSVCKGEMDYQASYCEWCGAKVVDE